MALCCYYEDTDHKIIKCVLATPPRSIGIVISYCKWRTWSGIEGDGLDALSGARDFVHLSFVVRVDASLINPHIFRDKAVGSSARVAVDPFFVSWLTPGEHRRHHDNRDPRHEVVHLAFRLLSLFLLSPETFNNRQNVAQCRYGEPQFTFADIV